MKSLQKQLEDEIRRLGGDELSLDSDDSEAKETINASNDSESVKGEDHGIKVAENESIHPGEEELQMSDSQQYIDPRFSKESS